MIDLAAEAKQPNPTRPRRRWRWILAAGAVLLVAAGTPTAVWFAHWRSSLRPLAAYPVAGARTPVAAGHTMYFDDMADYSRVFTHPHDPGTLTLHVASIRPVVAKNTAGASVVVEQCVLFSLGHYLLGVGASEARLHCTTLRPLRSGTVTLGYAKGDVDIVVAITPKHAGVVKVKGVDVSFSAGWRHGAQHTGVQAQTITR